MAINRIEDIKEYLRLAKADPMKLMQLQNQTEMPIINRAIGRQVGQPAFVDDDMNLNEKVEVGSLHEMLTTPSRRLDDDSLAGIGLEILAKKAAPAIAFALDKPEIAAVSGGLMGMVAGDDPMPVEQTISMDKFVSTPTKKVELAMGGGIRNFEGQVPGEGHGMEDNVFMPIIERERGKQVATLAVSPDEYVVDAHTMSALGNGSADAGAKVMDRVVDNVRKKAFGTDKQPNEINGLSALRTMIERV